MSLHAQQLSDSVRVHFRVNQTEIDTLLMGNNQSLQGFLQRLGAEVGRGEASKPINLSTSQPNIRIESIIITGAASPEGSMALNEHLSRQRAAAISTWLGENFEFPDNLPQYVFKGRDWQGLLDAVNNDNEVPYRNEVIQCLHNIINGTTQEDGVVYLKSLHGGVPYCHLAKKYFSRLRAAEVFITATYRDAINRASIDETGGTTNITNTNGTIATDAPSTPADDAVADAINRIPTGGYTFAVKTNMLYDVLATPNLGVECPIGRHFSVGANWMYAWWHNHDRNRQWKIYGGDINARYYFGGGYTSRASLLRSMTGHHIGVYGQVLVFQIAFGGKGYITGIPGENLWGKPYLGGGIEYGYSMKISRRLNIDFSLGLGYMTGEYRTYRPIDGHYVWQSSHRRNWIGPTKAEVTLVWLIGKGVER